MVWGGKTAAHFFRLDIRQTEIVKKYYCKIIVFEPKMYWIKTAKTIWWIYRICRIEIAKTIGLNYYI